ncbi:Spt21p Ecym_2163 [Eremothecium cymbalariae DBVPG|uniref:Ams2/SPT21 N-terminal domain-containing protein n=1 Tax=Eremothecium cymbalariae (strain CBS 270.75 / DBVPG 7215 / KCTC 17166 / NRRL Y-17582) TaxID=931890 RepID=G8JNJ9_ERECY|nr:Hypothetical protein Ecym_2163 [Eremothecium cymbalariae DBVPG\
MEEMSGNQQEAYIEMSVKILYTVDNESNSFLTRSKQDLPVRVEMVPSNSSPSKCAFRIGVVEVVHVLNEVYKSSPELFPPDGSGGSMMTNSDYNVYFKDVVEADEPFVSLGLLSRLRSGGGGGGAETEGGGGGTNGGMDDGSNGTGDRVEDVPLVIGRICTNFTSLLTRSSSAASAKARKTPEETLEVKMRFSKVITRSNSRRSSISKPYPAKRINSNMAVVGSNTTMSKKMTAGTPAGVACATGKYRKRDTNPMPAPKAFRTQSLPIWDHPKASGIRGGTIAHKIYMADRNKEQLSNQQFLQQSGVIQDRKPTYQVTSLQHDTTVSKFKVDDSISKRFDFMNKPKSKKGLQSKSISVQASSSSGASANGSLSSSKKTTSKATIKAQTSRRNSESTNVTIDGNSTVVGSSSLTVLNSKLDHASKEFRILSGESNLQDYLSQQQSKGNELFELEAQNDSPSINQNNKENVPPATGSLTSHQLLTSDLDAFFNLDLENMKHSEDEWFQGLFATPRDVNTCNTIPIEDENENDNEREHELVQAEIVQHETSGGTAGSSAIRKTAAAAVLANESISDTDRTSPIDTLSMPLLDLEPRFNQPSKFVSCADQLKRLPLLIKGKNNIQGNNTPADEDIGDEGIEDISSMEVSGAALRVPETTPGTNPATAADTVPNSTAACGSKRSSSDDVTSDYDDDEENLESMKKRRTMPSSPTSMFLSYKEDSAKEVYDDPPDTSYVAADEFAMVKIPNNHNSTPSTYRI